MLYLKETWRQEFDEIPEGAELLRKNHDTALAGYQAETQSGLYSNGKKRSKNSDEPVKRMKVDGRMSRMSAPIRRMGVSTTKVSRMGVSVKPKKA